MKEAPDLLMCMYSISFSKLYVSMGSGFQLRVIVIDFYVKKVLARFEIPLHSFI